MQGSGALPVPRGWRTAFSAFVPYVTQLDCQMRGVSRIYDEPVSPNGEGLRGAGGCLRRSRPLRDLNRHIRGRV